MQEQKTLGDIYRETVSEKVKQILPLLNGLSQVHIEDIAKGLIESAKMLPLSTNH